MSHVNLHFEGHRDLRLGFHKLLEPHVARARQQRIRFRLIAGGSHAETIKDFLRSCREQPASLNVLLIDSEEPVTGTPDFIQSLRARSYWDTTAACSDDQVNLMVQTMESWFIADPQALAAHFGQAFAGSSLPSPQQAESTSPPDLTKAIGQSLRSPNRRGRRYDKARDGAALLALIDRATVSRHCPHFRRLMDFLAREI